MAQHLARLQRSLGAIGIDTGRSTVDWEKLVLDMLKRSGLGDCMVYLQVTRGVAKRDHAFPADAAPTVFCMVSPFTRPGAQARKQGLSAVGIPEIGRASCRERGCQYVSIRGVADSFKKKETTTKQEVKRI